MAVPISVPCIDDAMLAKLAAGDLSPNELTACEEHLSSCELCRQLVDGRALDTVWTEELLPAFQTSLDDDDRTIRTEATHQAVLKILGPTDDPHMLGRIGGYEVVALVGIGGMGAVFKAFDAALNRFVAIKMMLPHLAATGAARQRFEREGRAAAAVVSDFVLPIYAVAEWQGVPYLVMQYSAGINLQKRIENSGPLKLHEVLRIAMQTARGLAAAHAQGLVHRDVKPSNILLDGTVERAMLTDFGLARAVDDASVTRTGLIAGTPQFMSPEQVRGEPVDARSDLFSLGSTIYSMCTGHPPFRADSSYAVLHRIVSDTPRSIREINCDIPEWLERIVGQLLSKTPHDRFDNAQQVADLLESCLAHIQQPTAVPLPQSLLQTASWTGRFSRFIKIVASAAIFLLMLAGVVIVLELDKGTLTIECEADDVPIQIMQGDTIVKKLTVSRDGKSTRIAAGKYTIEIEKPYDKAMVTDGSVIISLGGKQVVKVKSSLEQVQAKQEEQFAIVSYDLRNLLGDCPAALTEVVLTDVVKLVCSTINPESWSHSRARIATYPANRSIVVSQTAKNHKAIAKLLMELEAQADRVKSGRDSEQRINDEVPSNTKQGAVDVTRDSESGIVEIRGDNRALVERTAEALRKLNDQPKSHSSDKSNEATKFLKLFEAIYASQTEKDSQQIPVALLRDCFPGVGQPNPTKTSFQLTSIGSIKRSQHQDGKSIYEFEVDGLKLFREFLFILFDGHDTADRIAEGMLLDFNGPQLNIEKVLREQLSKKVKLTASPSASGHLNALVEIDVIDRSAFMPNFRKFFQSEAGYLSNESKDFFYFSTQPSTSGPSRRFAATVHNGRFYWGALELVEAVRAAQ